MARSVDVSVIIPTYQSEEHVGSALASVCASDLADIEVLVVDAGSTDGTVEVVRQIERVDDRVRLVGPPGRRSAPVARNVALRHAVAPVVACLDADDQMLPDRLVRQREALLAEPRLAAVAGLLRRVDASGVPIRWSGSDPERFASSPDVTRFRLAWESPTVSSGLMYRAAALRSVGGFVVDAPFSDDYHLVWRLAGVGGVRVVPEYVGRYRIHEGQASRRHRATQELEVLRLRRRIAAEITGTEPAFRVVLAWGRPERVADRSEALAALDEYHRCFVDRLAPSAADRDVIAAVHAERRARLAHPEATTRPDSIRTT